MVILGGWVFLMSEVPLYPPITWKEERVSRKQENVPYLVPAHHLHVEGSGFRVQGSGFRVQG